MNKPSYFVIGVFFLFAIAMCVLGVIIFGSGHLNKQEVLFETYLDESVQGLSVGAPVSLRGVQLGRVKDITFASSIYDSNSKDGYDKYIVVIMAADSKAFVRNTSSQIDSEFENMITNGLRLRISTHPLTGISYLEADYFDSAEHKCLAYSWKPKLKYVPSTKSLTSRFINSADSALQRIANLPIDELGINMNELLITMKQAIDDAQFAKATAEATGLMSELRITNHQFQLILGPDSPDNSVSIPEVLNNLDSTLAQLSMLLQSQSPQIQQIMESINQASDNIRQLTENLNANPSQLLSKPPKPLEIMK